MTISAADFDYISRYVHDSCGMALERGKEYLVESRLTPLAQAEGWATLAELVNGLRNSPKNGLHQKTIDALTTNETLFFRDFHPFEALRQEVLPRLIAEAASRPVTIWSAACSTGQEPYSVAILIHHWFPQLTTRVRILGTDICSRVLARAVEAAYSQAEVNRGLPAPILVKYFRQQGDRWVLRPEVREMVEFRQLNLSEAWPISEVFDVILLRNVMIYLNGDTRRRILLRMRECLHPDGVLFLGTAENALNDGFEAVMMKNAIAYRRQHH